MTSWSSIYQLVLSGFSLLFLSGESSASLEQINDPLYIFLLVFLSLLSLSVPFVFGDGVCFEKLSHPSYDMVGIL